MRSFLGPVKRAKVYDFPSEGLKVQNWVTDIAPVNTIVPTVHPNFLAIGELEIRRRW
jgi:hypothetical protein